MRGARPDRSGDGGEGYGVSAILGLLALLTGFTFSLAIERFETRRELVLQHANAIGTAYLRVQLLPEPHRMRLSTLLTAYTDNAIALAGAPAGEGAPLAAKDDEFLTRLWAATAAGYDSVRELPFSNELVSSMNTLIDTDGARRAARSAHVPTVVFAVLFIYLVGTAGVLGCMLKSPRGRFAGIFLLISADPVPASDPGYRSADHGEHTRGTGTHGKPARLAGKAAARRLRPLARFIKIALRHIRASICFAISKKTKATSY